ncbi:hypothetical protein Dimus_018627 [Dionaea muscipula]
MGKPRSKEENSMHTNARKEFYANLTVFIYKKKEIAKSRVKGVEIEFDSMKPASIPDVPRHTGIVEYIKDVREESKYIKPPEITVEFANNGLINVARRVQLIEIKPFQRFQCILWSAAVGNPGSMIGFYAQVDVEEPVIETPAAPAIPASPGDSTTHQKEQTPVGVDPSSPSGYIPES